MMYIGRMISLEQINYQLARQTEAERIQWAWKEFGRQLVMTTSFGTYSAVMLHLTKRYAPDASIISVDTGHNAETRAFAEKLIAQIGITVERFQVPGPPTDKSHPVETPEEYLQRRKVDILEQALKKHQAKAWMSGVQRNETDHRKEFDFLMQRSDGLYKFHPLLDWDSRRLFSYCKANSLPINDDYYDPAKGKDQKQECGIHLTGMANESFTASEL